MRSDSITVLESETPPLLAAVAESRKEAGLAYAGEVLPEEVFAYLAKHPGILIDVRTLPEWQAGMPDLSPLGQEALAISWKIWPDYTLNPEFKATLEAVAVMAPDTPLFFLCRSGGRSLDAAVAMTASGYRQCYNVIGGFEGPPNEQGQRGTVSGWKAAGLPCKTR